MPYVNPTVVLLDRKGVAITEGGKPITVGDVIIAALDSIPANGKWGTNDKFERFMLQMRLSTATSTIQITLEEALLIKKLMNEVTHFGPLIYGRVMQELEPELFEKIQVKTTREKTE